MTVPGECVLWVGVANSWGYGPHRRAFERAYGYLPEIVRHLCGVKLCQNPDHLAGGTQSDNLLDPDVARTGTPETFKCGHPRSGENRGWKVCPANRSGQQDRCKTCARIYTRQRREAARVGQRA